MSLITPDNVGMSEQERRQKEQMQAISKLIKEAPDMVCEKCNGIHYVNVHRIKVVSGLASGTGTDMVVPISLYACADCGHVNQYFASKVESGEVN